VLGIVGVPLLVSCGVERSGASAPPSTSRSASTSLSTTAVPTTTTVAAASAPEVRQAFDAAAARYPNLDVGLCTFTTPLTDPTCGAMLAAVNDIATTAAQTLAAQGNPLHGPVLSAAADVGSAYAQLLDPIPCYGLSAAPPPPPPLVAEATDLCAEGADITKSYWNILRTEVSLLGDPP